MPDVDDSWKEYNTAKNGGILKSPYNFIDPPNQVYETPWKTNKLANRFGDSNVLPSHSKPFAEAICGTLEIDWTFETPFLIGGADDGNSPVKYGGKYVLPGASIRGMLRNVLEIATAARVCHMDREARTKKSNETREVKSVREVAEQSAPAFKLDEDGILDFIQPLFGHVPEDGVSPQEGKPLTQIWKGRVFFRHGELHPQKQSINTCNKFGATESPRPTFAPYYLRPKPGYNSNEMLHWARENIRLAGRKRYPMRERLGEFSSGSAGNTSKMNFISSGGSSKKEVTFRSKIKIHNLHPIELGGLIWAIGFCNLGEENTPWRHAMGRGKPQGYGRVRGLVFEDSLKLKTNKGIEVVVSSLSEQFEKWLCEQAGKTGVNDIEHIAELRAMANPAIGQIIAKEKMLEYPNDDGDSLEGHKTIVDEAKRYDTKKPALHLWRYPKGQRGDS